MENEIVLISWSYDGPRGGRGKESEEYVFSSERQSTFGPCPGTRDLERASPFTHAARKIGTSRWKRRGRKKAGRKERWRIKKDERRFSPSPTGQWVSESRRPTRRVLHSPGQLAHTVSSVKNLREVYAPVVDTRSVRAAYLLRRHTHGKLFVSFESIFADSLVSLDLVRIARCNFDDWFTLPYNFQFIQTCTEKKI